MRPSLGRFGIVSHVFLVTENPIGKSLVSELDSVSKFRLRSLKLGPGTKLGHSMSLDRNRKLKSDIKVKSDSFSENI